MTDDETAHEESTETAGEPSGASSVAAAESVDDGDVSPLERELAERREPYARATVVRREPPVSANVGDRAIVTAAGDLHGWIGGVACAQSIVTEQARRAIERDEPTLVGIAPDPETIDRPGLEAFRTTCHGEGVLEVFVEPVKPTTELVVVGDSPVARSLARLADELALEVTLVVAEDDGDRSVPASTDVLATVDPERIADAVGRGPLVVVASMGRYDARGIAAAVLAGAPYVGLIASDSRAAAATERAAELLDRDPSDVRDAVTNPAGVDVAAYTPAEIAASVLAELVDVRSRGSTTPGAAGVSGDDAADVEHVADRRAGERDDGTDEPAVDPVCGTTVQRESADATVEYDGGRYYFCCRGCADSFENDPSAYLEREGIRS